MIACFASTHGAHCPPKKPQAFPMRTNDETKIAAAATDQKKTQTQTISMTWDVSYILCRAEIAMS
jgi:hypothetical protein